MSVPTKTRLTKSQGSTATNNESIPWREAAKKEIRKYSEGGMMLRGSRYKEDVTQKELAKAIGVCPHHISEMENGKRPIGKEMAKRIAAFFKMDYRILL